MIDREAIIADAVNGETSKAIARRHGCSVKNVYEILDEHASEVLTQHNRVAPRLYWFCTWQEVVSAGWRTAKV